MKVDVIRRWVQVVVQTINRWRLGAIPTGALVLKKRHLNPGRSRGVEEEGFYFVRGRQLSRPSQVVWPRVQVRSYRNRRSNFSSC